MMKRYSLFLFAPLLGFSQNNKNELIKTQHFTRQLFRFQSAGVLVKQPPSSVRSKTAVTYQDPITKNLYWWGINSQAALLRSAHQKDGQGPDPYLQLLNWQPQMGSLKKVKNLAGILHKTVVYPTPVKKNTANLSFLRTQAYLKKINYSSLSGNDYSVYASPRKADYYATLMRRPGAASLIQHHEPVLYALSQLIPINDTRGIQLNAENIQYDSANRRLGIGITPAQFTLDLKNSIDADNLIRLTNTHNSGYSAIRFDANEGNAITAERGAIGYSNSSGIYPSRLFIESSNFNPGSYPPDFIIAHSDYLNNRTYTHRTIMNWKGYGGNIEAYDSSGKITFSIDRFHSKVKAADFIGQLTGNATTATTVTAAAQPAITSLGNLDSLKVTHNLQAATLVTANHAFIN